MASGWLDREVLNVSQPFYTDGVFDRTLLRDFGLEIHGEGTIELYVDDIGY